MSGNEPGEGKREERKNGMVAEKNVGTLPLCVRNLAFITNDDDVMMMMVTTTMMIGIFAWPRLRWRISREKKRKGKKNHGDGLSSPK